MSKNQNLKSEINLKTFQFQVRTLTLYKYFILVLSLKFNFYSSNSFTFHPYRLRYPWPWSNEIVSKEYMRRLYVCDLLMCPFLLLILKQSNAKEIFLSARNSYLKKLSWSCCEITISAGTGLETLHLNVKFSYLLKLIFYEVLIGWFDLTI